MRHEGRTALLALSLALKGDWDKIYEALQKKDMIVIDEGMKLVEQVRSKYVTVLDPDYPESLKQQCHKPPLVLYYYGDLSLAEDTSQILTVVGSRDPTPYAEKKTREICAAMAEKGYIICSGLARGIDTAAGEASSAFPGKSIAVLGNGIDFIYPAENEALQRKIAANGLLISEYPGMTKPEPHQFPLRNRILACLSQGTFIAEAKPRSGTLITAAFAMRFNRDVAALPFAVDEGFANNQLIKNGAALIESVEDMVLFMRPRFGMKK